MAAQLFAALVKSGWAGNTLHMLRHSLFALVFCGVFQLPAMAGEADVLEVEIRKDGDGTYTITATVEHGDDGWDHFANVWEVLGPDGAVLAVRELAHPHMNEQPFIRSKSGVKIPEGVTEITVRAGDLVHGFGGETVSVAVPVE